MALILIKNNLKLMLRSKWILCIMVIMPLIVMGVLSSVFKEMLTDDYTLGEVHGGYIFVDDRGEEISSGTQEVDLRNTPEFQEAWKAFRKGCEENDIFLKEYEAASDYSLLEQGEMDVFLKIGRDKITIYQTEDSKLMASVLGNALSSFELNFQGAMLLKDYLTGNPQAMMDYQKVSSEDGSGIKAEKLDADPIPNAMDYYGIIEIVYFAWCGMVSLSVVISGERKNRIESRLQIAPVSKFALYMGKMVPCFLATAVEIGISVFLSLLLYDVHWGRPFASAGIVLLLCLASSGVGVLLFYLFKSVVVSIVTGYLAVMVIGFLGGTFNMYMYAYPEHLEKLSIQYYINRTLVEFTTKGESAYVRGCLIYLVATIVISVAVGMLVMNKRMENE